MIIEVYNLIPL